MINEIQIIKGHVLDCLKTIQNNTINCVITSPPYYKTRDYGEDTIFIWDDISNCSHLWNEKNFCINCNAWKGQLGQEPTPDLYLKHLLDIFDEVYRVLKDDGNVFIVISDAYSKKGNLLLLPYLLANGLQLRGWIIRDLIIWAKKVYDLNNDTQIGNGLPESTRNRLVKSYEIVIHAVKSMDYYFYKPTTKRKTNYKRDVISKKSKFVNADKINVGKSIAGRLVKNIQEGKTHTFVRTALCDVNLYLKQKLKESKLTLKKLAKLTEIKEDTIAHYFRTDKSGAALPSKEYWSKINQFLNLGNYEDFIKEEYKSIFPKLSDKSYICNVIKCNTEKSSIPHFAIMPKNLVDFLLTIGCPKNGVVLDIFAGIGTVGLVAISKQINSILIEANKFYVLSMYKLIKSKYPDNDYVIIKLKDFKEALWQE